MGEAIIEETDYVCGLNLRLDLPMDHSIIGYIDACGRAFVACSLNRRHHPFAVWRLGGVNERGRVCVGGDYFQTRTEAIQCLSRRATN